MRNIPKIKNFISIYPLIILVMAGVSPIFYYNDWAIHLMILSLMYAVMSLGWILLALAGNVSLGNAIYFGLGAYFTIFSIMKWNLSSYEAIGIIIAISSLAAIFIGYLTFRFGISGVYFALTTIAFAEILRELFIFFREYTGGSLGTYILFKDSSLIEYFAFDSKLPYLYFIIGFTFLVYIILIFPPRTKKFLMTLRAIGEDELAAAALGINLLKYKLAAFIIGSILTSLMGWLYIHYMRYITPDVGFGLSLSLYIALLGIASNLRLEHVVLVAMILTPLGELMRAVTGAILAGLDILIYGLLIMLIIIIRILMRRRR
jgi:branched-chain amino acid transport system permease protein